MKIVEGHLAVEPAAGIPVLDVDPYDPETLSDPYGYYAELRSLGPLVFIPKYSIFACGRYSETQAVFSDYERFVSSRGVGLNDFRIGKPWRAPSIILEVDPPDHSRTRKIMARALAPKPLAQFREFFRETAETQVDALLARGSFEAVSDFAEMFPTTVFPRALGMRDSDPRRLVDYGAMVFNALGPDHDIRRAAMDKAPDILPWINAACTRERLTSTGLGAIIYAASDTGEITANEAGMLVRSFLSAGVDTTVTAIGNALWCFASNPEAFEALKANPGLARGAFEEVMRFTSPVHTFARTANRDTEVAGHFVPEGAKVLCVLASANRDPAKWGDADVFRIDRNPVGHLAFGTGVHGCVGQNLARLEIEIVLQALAQKVDRIEFDGPPVWRPGNAIHALDRLPLRFLAR
jgi:4-methoxybenzoate monooxygenase (O-demethylating)